MIDENDALDSSAERSMPKPPLPANKSRPLPPEKYGPIILNIASLTLSVVGRVDIPGTACRRRPLHVPEITLIAFTQFTVSRWPCHPFDSLFSW
ncbi:hypothetical protein I656_02316 [Geobacillus sp. WSUCF1]|nr:hypothetical protein I656_02316 [Geobacillus sp. WSUCF1]